MARLLPFLILFNIAIFVQAFSDHKQCNKYDEPIDIRIRNINTKLTGECLYGMNKREPRKSHMTSLPFILTTLSQLYLFSGEPTTSEIGNVLNIRNAEEVKTFFPAAIKKFNSKGVNEITWKIKVYVNNSRIYTKEFEESYEKYFFGQVDHVDFSKRCEAARDINNWFDCQISDPGVKMLPCEAVKKHVGMVFANTYKVEADLSSSFKPLCVKKLPFHLSESQTFEVPALYGIGMVKYGRIGSYGHGYRIQLKNSPNSLLLVKGNVPKLLELFRDQKIFDAFLERLIDTNMTLTFPHLNVKGGTDFVSHFEALGVLFSLFKPHGGEFNHVFKYNDSVYISNLLQKNSIKVNEGLKQCDPDSQEDSEEYDLPNHVIDGPFLYIFLCDKSSPMLSGTCYGDCHSGRTC
ncbi:antichymotrypsin-2 [Manduca sexta]|uniref:antichymotrypsin-2 n=1 Tax=Manduca sexta TaxID=7130 RepID=UPI00188FF360|nr:antichymotrypsin-2 [Manduca sexta]